MLEIVAVIHIYEKSLTFSAATPVLSWLDNAPAALPLLSSVYMKTSLPLLLLLLFVKYPKLHIPIALDLPTRRNPMDYASFLRGDSDDFDWMAAPLAPKRIC